VRAYTSVFIYLFAYARLSAPRFLYLFPCVSAGICFGMYLCQSQTEFLSISEDTWDSVNITCKGRDPHCRRLVCAEAFVDLDTVARWHDGRTGTFLNVIMHTVSAHYTSPGRQESLHVSHISMQLASSWNIISPVAQKGKTRSAVMFPRSHEKKPELPAFKANRRISVHFGSLGETALYCNRG